MILRRTICAFCFLLFAVPAPVLHAEDNAKKQAKELAEKAKGEGSERAKQVQDLCAAAQLQPKEKKYAETCNSFRTGLIQDDTALLASAIAAYKNHDLDKTESQAKLVSSFDDKLSGQAKFLLDRIKSERVFNQVKASWEKGDFNAVITLAQGITNSDFKAAAAIYTNNISQYNGYIDQAGKLQADNPQEAIKLLALAQSLNPNGPDNPAGKIAELQKAIQAKSAALASAPKPGADSATDIAKKVSKLIGDAHNAEKQGNLQDAINDYAMVLKLQPGNQEAQSNTSRIQQAVKNDPAAARNELISAIRYFYHAQFDEAQNALKEYLKNPQTAQNPGAAYFYLGATLLEQSMLETPRAQGQGPSADAQSAFKEARKANYNPARNYVSPALLKVWDSTSQ